MQRGLKRQLSMHICVQSFRNAIIESIRDMCINFRYKIEGYILCYYSNVHNYNMSAMPRAIIRLRGAHACYSNFKCL